MILPFLAQLSLEEFGGLRPANHGRRLQRRFKLGLHLEVKAHPTADSPAADVEVASSQDYGEYG